MIKKKKKKKTNELFCRRRSGRSATIGNAKATA